MSSKIAIAMIFSCKIIDGTALYATVVYLDPITIGISQPFALNSKFYNCDLASLLKEILTLTEGTIGNAFV